MTARKLLRGRNAPNPNIDALCCQTFLDIASANLDTAAKFWPDAASHCDGLRKSIHALKTRVKKEGGTL